MRREHLDRLKPICPACRLANRPLRPLVPGTIVRSDGDDILEGVLVCTEPACQREHPIVDGIAIVVGDLPSWAAHQLDAVLRRDDLSAFMESLLGDAAGPGAHLDRERTTLSAYGYAHWGELEPSPADVAGAQPRTAAMVDLVDAAFDLAGAPPRGLWIDLGCATGRATFELARRTGDLAVGVDLSFALLRVAERARRQGRAVFPLRRVGLVYDRCDLVVPDMLPEQLSFWCCDVTALPFADAAFDGALSLNLLDCVPSPIGHLLELGRILRAGATALLSSPYDWTPTATPVDQWFGGHSQRGAAHGSSSLELHRILQAVPTGLMVHNERDRVPWRVYVNERASMDYAVHLVELERSAVSG